MSEETKTISFKTSSFAGDVIYYLSGIKSVCEKQNAKAKVYLWLDRLANPYPGATHPTKDLTGTKIVGLNHYMMKMLKPLLESQDYIESVETWNGEFVAIDLDRIRELRIGQPNGDLRMWAGYVYSDMCCNIGDGAIELPEHEIEVKGLPDNRFIVVNRTERYLNEQGTISYFFLKNYPVLFVGVPKEFHIFKKEVPNAVHIQPTDFYELAQLIKSSVLMIGNQSFCFAIAEQLKVNRVLEVCAYAPNVIVAGKNGYPFLTQQAFEYYVDKLWKGERA